MRPAWVRSALFNIAFFIVTGIMCLLFLPALLFPRRVFTGLVYLWIQAVTILEYIILDLKYEIRGTEHLPKSGSYIVAAKHQSAYETIKLRVLFPDPAIILKKELLRIPFWGWYLDKSGVIAIDRSTPDLALKSIAEGAIKMAAAGRPIIIFPQGTRVTPESTPAQKPYKQGVARIQDATNLPIIPMALNTGLFWPRHLWKKSPGTVIFEFLPPIPPGKEKSVLLKELEEKTENASKKLMDEARAENSKRKTSSAGILVSLATIFTGYYFLWSYTAEQAVHLYSDFLKNEPGVQRTHANPVVTGFPGAIKITSANDSIISDQGSIRIETITATGWPFPYIPIRIQTGQITVKSFSWPENLIFDSLESRFTIWNGKMTLHDSLLTRQNFKARLTGIADFSDEPAPNLDMNIALENHESLLSDLVNLKIIEKKQSLFASAGFSMMTKDGVATVPLTRSGQTIYAGPLPVAYLPAAHRPVRRNWPDPGQ